MLSLKLFTLSAVAFLSGLIFAMNADNSNDSHFIFGLSMGVAITLLYGAAYSMLRNE